MGHSRIFLQIVLLWSLVELERGFYVPGVAPVEFLNGANIDVRVGFVTLFVYSVFFIF